MPILTEYALTPDIFDSTSYISEEVGSVYLQALKDVLLQDGLVRDLRDGEWAKTFGNTSRQWHQRGKELLKKLQTQHRTVLARATQATKPETDAEWCVEALGSHGLDPLAGVITTNATATAYAGNTAVSAVTNLVNALWWNPRIPSLRLARTLAEYQAALKLVLRHANSLLFIDPFIDPTDHRQYGDLMTLLASLGTRVAKPVVEIHRASWYGVRANGPDVNAVVNAIRPGIQTVATSAGVKVEVFLWDTMHDRYLITDLVGISLPNGFGTTRAPNAKTTWTQLSRKDRDDVQREFDPACRGARHRFTVCP